MWSNLIRHSKSLDHWGNLVVALNVILILMHAPQRQGEGQDRLDTKHVNHSGFAGLSNGHVTANNLPAAPQRSLNQYEPLLDNFPDSIYCLYNLGPSDFSMDLFSATLSPFALGDPNNPPHAPQFSLRS